MRIIFVWGAQKQNGGRFFFSLGGLVGGGWFDAREVQGVRAKTSTCRSTQRYGKAVEGVGGVILRGMVWKYIIL